MQLNASNESDNKENTNEVLQGYCTNYKLIIVFRKKLQKVNRKSRKSANVFVFRTRHVMILTKEI